LSRLCRPTSGTRATAGEGDNCEGGFSKRSFVARTSRQCGRGAQASRDVRARRYRRDLHKPPGWSVRYAVLRSCAHTHVHSHRSLWKIRFRMISFAWSLQRERTTGKRDRWPFCFHRVNRARVRERRRQATGRCIRIVYACRPERYRTGSARYCGGTSRRARAPVGSVVNETNDVIPRYSFCRTRKSRTVRDVCGFRVSSGSRRTRRVRTLTGRRTYMPPPRDIHYDARRDNGNARLFNTSFKIIRRKPTSRGRID